MSCKQGIQCIHTAPSVASINLLINILNEILKKRQKIIIFELCAVFGQMTMIKTLLICFLKDLYQTFYTHLQYVLNLQSIKINGSLERNEFKKCVFQASFKMCSGLNVSIPS